jgi:(S)-2-hydroxyglutarate dehydrogenase
MLRQVTAEQAARIEPLARTHVRALWSPSTAVSDPVAVLRHQVAEATGTGTEVRMGARVTGAVQRSGRVEVQLRTVDDGAVTVEAGHFINAAGLYADRLAHGMGYGLRYRLLPFVGLYMYVNDLPLRRLVYPVPAMDRPFLGVHFTVTAAGKVKIGPTAIPALWREQYPREAGSWRRFSASEMAETLATQAGMALRDGGFRQLAWEEVRKYGRAAMSNGAGALLRDGLHPRQLGQWGRAGIRAQLVRLPAPSGGVGGTGSSASAPAGGAHAQQDGAQPRTGGAPQLEMDYVVEGGGVGGHVTHILNAVSPGWTSARPFAHHVVDTMILGPQPGAA